MEAGSTLFNRSTVKNGDKYYCCEKEHTLQEEFDKFRFVKIKVTKEDNIEREEEVTNGSRFVIITSMDKKYYEASGKAMMQSYKRHGRLQLVLMCIMNNYLNPK